MYKFDSQSVPITLNPLYLEFARFVFLFAIAYLCFNVIQIANALYKKFNFVSFLAINIIEKENNYIHKLVCGITFKSVY